MKMYQPTKSIVGISWKPQILAIIFIIVSLTFGACFTSTKEKSRLESKLSGIYYNKSLNIVGDTFEISSGTVKMNLQNNGMFIIEGPNIKKDFKTGSWNVVIGDDSSWIELHGSNGKGLQGSFNDNNTIHFKYSFVEDNDLETDGMLFEKR